MDSNLELSASPTVCHDAEKRGLAPIYIHTLSGAETPGYGVAIGVPKMDTMVAFCSRGPVSCMENGAVDNIAPFPDLGTR